MIVLRRRGVLERSLVLLAVPPLLIGAAGCGDDPGAGAGDTPTVAVTTSILSDVVAELVGDQAEVVTVMPVGADPHEFQASAREADQVRRADALVVNGGGFEEGLLDLIESVGEDGVPVHEVVSSDLADDEEGHEHAEYVHFFTDPVRMAEAVEHISAFLAGAVPAIDAEALEVATDGYVSGLELLHAHVEAALSDIAPQDRVLVTGHDVFGAFAGRYGFEVVGTVIPSGSTGDGANARDLAQLADIVRETGVPAVFTDAASSDGLARTLASEVGEVEVVPLFTESLGEEGSGAETYVGMVRTNAERIAAGLGAGAP